MAADLVMPTMATDQQQSRHFLPKRPHHSRSRSYQVPQGPQISPINTSDLTSNQTVSTPPSPRAHNVRQARPLYMPAALRPNDEFPSRMLTKTKTGDTTISDSDSDSTLRHSGASFMSLTGLNVLGNRLNRRSTGDSTRIVEGNWNLDLFPQVTDLPSRSHWKPDTESSICDDPTCKRGFNYFIRRHHCRKCGNIFCDWHSSLALPLDQDVKFNPRAAPSRTCNHCFDEFKAWRSRSNSQAMTSASDAQNMGSGPIAAGGNTAGLLRSAEIAASVPRDWNWSTF